MQKYFKPISEMLETKSGHFFIGFIVIINAIILGIQTFQSVPELLELFLRKIDKAILAIFVIELCIKLLGNGLSFFRSGWNVFDFLIVVGSFLNHQDFLPVLRAFRVLHLMSMVDASPKMQHILNGFWKAIPGIAHVLGILLLFFYIYCVMGVFLFKDLGIAEFQHIGIAMKTMFQVLTGDDWGNLMKASEKFTHYAWMYFISFYIILVFIILNLFIGVVVGSLQAAEEEAFSEDEQNDQQVALNDLKAQITRLEKKINKLLGS